MKKLILRCGLSPGDIVMLTAAVRDLHRCYPGQFTTDVRTVCPELWEHNPYITPLLDDDPEAQELDCSYPLIDRSNEAPYHCLHGFIEFLNDRLGLAVKPTAFRGDIHLTEEERNWFSQVHELTGEKTPFWIIGAGGKYDITIKWWETRRYQQVVDRFRDKLLFVQVGAPGHHHPRLEGTIDLRGKTSLRELVRLVYHAQGVLCGVTALMHLAAAVPVRSGPGRNRPCVVVAGGREPVHWEAYPDHQYIATTGALPCCANGGCWKARTVPLGDGDERDHPDHLCTNVVGGLPRCMELITPDEVIRRIELYFRGGVLRSLSQRERIAARRGVKKSLGNDYDRGPLTLHNARLACERFLKRLPPYPGGFRGRGIVICGGGVKYFTGAWVCIHMLRRMGCSLPIQLWHLGEREMDETMKSLVAPLGVECVDAHAVAEKHPVRRLGGWELKPYAILHCPFREVLFLDADNVPVRNPAVLFDTPQYQKTGAIFWPDYGRMEKTQTIWDNCGLDRPPGPEFESGQIVVDKKRCWQALSLALWFNEHSDFYYQHLHGDKETFHLAFHRLRKSYGFVATPARALLGTMCQHDFEGNRLFQHRNTDKWSLIVRNTAIEDFWYEAECRACLADLEHRWKRGLFCHFRTAKPRGRHASGRRALPTIKACMISCPEREAVRLQTLRSLAASDWGEAPAFVQLDANKVVCPQERQRRNAWLALTRCLDLQAEYVLFLEDDLEFNRYIRHNLSHWEPLQRGDVTLGSLYNPKLPAIDAQPEKHCAVMSPAIIFGSQAFILSRETLEHVVAHWDEIEGLQDIKMSRLASQLGKPLLYHMPSLVQHVGRESVWGGWYHRAADFDPCWKIERRPVC
jgi:ADP-heptose:LPS heptosyltransferase